ncbi:MAG TPA: chitobiase, partial [Segatella copri]|nr:chitobiase [Segatella copri]
IKAVEKFESTGITNITTDEAAKNAPVYNLAGQKVTKAYKGVVIKNGKKMIQK